MIREAELSDIPRLVEMGQRFISESSYKGRLARNPRHLAETMGKLIGSQDAALLVADDGREIIGMIGLIAYTQPLSGERIAGEMFWWVEPERRGIGLRLLKRAERWADAAGAVRIQMIAPTERVASAYRARGYAKLEECYQKDI